MHPHIILAFFTFLSAIAMGPIISTQAQEDDPIVILEAGEAFILQGQVLDTEGQPIVGAAVEIWSTDANGRYDHPQDSRPEQLEPDFQYFGTATTDENGYYAFQTLKPGAYEPRPTHIHFKVKLNDRELLTSQLYFVEEVEALDSDGVFRNQGGEALLLQVLAMENAEGDKAAVAERNIIIDLNGGGPDEFTPTPPQGEGPFYPVVDFSGYDNNLLSTAEDDETILPFVIAEE